jgi:hypothetical protein
MVYQLILQLSRQHSLENTDVQLLTCGHMLNHHSENQFEN